MHGVPFFVPVNLIIHLRNIRGTTAAKVITQSNASSRLRILAGVIAASIVFLPVASRADTATWLQSPSNDDWNNSANWTAGGPPNSKVDIATFAISNQTAVSLSANTEVNSIFFNNNANAYRIITGPGLVLTISGVGIVRNSMYSNTFATGVIDADKPERGEVWFTGSASAGSGNYFINYGRATNTLSGGRTIFFGNSTAGSGGLTQYGPTQVGGDGGRALFFDNASAGSAYIGNCGDAATTAQGDQSGRGVTSFYDNSTAGNAVISNVAGEFCGNAGGVTQFLDSSSAGNSTVQCFGSPTNTAPAAEINFFNNSTAGSAQLLAREGSGGGSGGAIHFRDNSRGATSRIEVRGNGFVDISDHDAPGVTLGSLIGSGNVLLGARNLSVSASPAGFDGVIQDGGEGGGTGGSLTKIGAETLFLLKANTYSGGTTITSGALYALHDHALGSGNVTVITPGTTLACQPMDVGSSNDFIADTATLSIVTTALVNLIYHGTDTIGVLIIDGVVQPPGLYGASGAFSTKSRAGERTSGLLGTGKLLAQLPVAVSRKVHGGTAYDVYLPSVGVPGIECRGGGGNSSYQVVVRFLNNGTFTSASVTSGNAMVSSVSGNGTTQATINLSAVTDHQTINITLFGLNDGLGLRDLIIPMAVFVGDTTGDGVVNSSDVSQTKGQSGQLLTTANFREDITVNGVINASDVAAVKSRAGTGLPAALVSPPTAPPRSGRRMPYLP